MADINLAAAPIAGAQWLLLPLIGFAAGVLGGLLGIGGGLIIIPALLLVLGQPFGPGSLHVFKIAALATAIVLSIPATRQHARARAIVPGMMPAAIGFGVGGVLAGVWLAGLLAGAATRRLQVLFGLTMLVFVAFQYWAALRRKDKPGIEGQSCPTPRNWSKVGLVVGLPAGVISGLLGIGGGAWAVPAQNLVLGIRLPTAIGNSTAMIVGVALAAAAVKSLSVAGMPGLHWLDGWRLALLLAPGAMVGGPIGAHLTHRLPVAKVRLVFLALLAVTGVRLIMN